MRPGFFHLTHGHGLFQTIPTLGAPNLAGTGSIVAGGNGNGSLDPNECAQLSLVVQNTGETTASNVTAVLATSVAGVSVDQAASTYPNIGPGALATNSTPFQISTLPSFPCGTEVALTLALSFPGNTNTLSFSVPSGGGNYIITPSSGATIVPGNTDIGNHGDDVVTAVSLPFNYLFYGQFFAGVNISANGNVQFLSDDAAYQNVCLPYGGFNYAIAPFWGDLRTDGAGGGIFTSLSGVAPHRIFNIEWRANTFGGGSLLNFELRLYEGKPRFDIVYGDLNGSGSTATVGAQKDTGSSSSLFECKTGGLSAGLQLAYEQSCADGGGTCGLLANFTGSPTTGQIPLTVNFTNLSTGAASFLWNFGNGRTSTQVNPPNIYSNPGAYTVSLIAFGPGSNTLTRTNYIVALPPPPTITQQPQSQNACPGDTISFTVTATGIGPFSYEWQKNTSALADGDHYSGASNAMLIVSPAAGGDIAQYRCVISNAGGSVTSSFAALTITDTTAPVISCPGPILIDADGGCGQFVAWIAPATDNCAVTNITCSPPSGSSFGLGATTVNCTAQDSSGNSASCAFSVTVEDHEGPILGCPANMLTNTTGGCAQVVNWSLSSADNCGLSSVTCSPTNGSVFALGTTIVTCTAMDGSGNTASCAFSITVADPEPPRLGCPAEIVAATTGGCGQVVTWPASASDNCAVTNQTCSPPSGSTFATAAATATVASSTSGSKITKIHGWSARAKLSPPRPAGAIRR